MDYIFNFIGSIFGYVLWFAFYLFKNYGVAIIIFTLLTRLLILPFSMKQQKSMASNMRFQMKQREIMEKYKNNRAKANEEIQNLMEKENIKPSFGCMPMIAPMIIMFGVLYSVRNPLTNTLHIAYDKVSEALRSITALPGIGTGINSQYGEISIIKYFSSLKNYLVDANSNSLFNAGETERIEDFSKGFNFLGLDLLATPSESSFQSMMWLIPVLCFVTSVASMFIIQKMNGTKIQGCMIVMILFMPLFSTWIAYIVPGAVGFYWIVSTIIGFIQSIILNKFYNVSIIEAKNEARRIVLRRQQEAAVAYVEAENYIAPSEVLKQINSADKQTKSTTKKQKYKKSDNNSSNYKGRKR